MSYFTEYMRRRVLEEQANPDEGKPEQIHPDDREKEYQPEDERQPWTFKPKMPMKLPGGVMRIVEAYQNPVLGDIEAEIHKEQPNMELYHLSEVFGTKLQSMPIEERKAIKVAKTGIFVVGGAVRDWLLSMYHPNVLHKGPRDWNLVSDSRPAITQLILLNANPTIPCKREGPAMVQAKVDDDVFGIETFHESPAGKGDKHDFVTFTTPYRDALRRDYRLNTLRYDPVKKVVLDELGGFGDIANGKITLKTVGQTDKVFQNNPVAALRGLRLHGKLIGGGTDTMDKDLLHGLKNFEIPANFDRQQVHDEFMKGLKAADDQGHYVALWGQLGKSGKSLLQQVFPGLEVSKQLGVQNNVHPHVATALVLRGNLPDRLDTVKSVLARSKFSPQETSDITFLLSLPRFTSPEQVDEFNAAYDRGSGTLVPSAVVNYAKLARLPNAGLIEKLMKHRNKGRHRIERGDDTAADTAPDQATKESSVRREREVADLKRFGGA